MKLIIEIDEDDYTMCQILANEMCDTRMKLTDNLKYAISNGIPLPEGHGDIVDIETLIDMFWDGNSMEITKYDLSVIKPIIEADKTESEVKHG